MFGLLITPSGYANMRTSVNVPTRWTVLESNEAEVDTSRDNIQHIAHLDLQANTRRQKALIDESPWNRAGQLNADFR